MWALAPFLFLASQVYPLTSSVNFFEIEIAMEG
jgi:hypothetical protein